LARVLVLRTGRRRTVDWMTRAIRLSTLADRFCQNSTSCARAVPYYNHRFTFIRTPFSFFSFPLHSLIWYIRPLRLFNNDYIGRSTFHYYNNIIYIIILYPHLCATNLRYNVVLCMCLLFTLCTVEVVPNIGVIITLY